MAILRKIRIALRLSLFLRYWWHKHLKSVESMVLNDEELDFMTKLIQPEVKKEEKEESLFDVASFKADRQQRISQEARRILTVLPQYRSDREIQYVMLALRCHKQIASYPVRMQRLIAQYGFLQCFNDKRAIVRQGHPPEAFYYILHGTVAVAVNDGAQENKITSLLEKGDSFGELAIISNLDRQSSVISKTYIELVSISREVYEDVFLSGGAKKITDPDHEHFIRSLDFLRGWPIQKLEVDPATFVFTYFTRGSVIVKDSHDSKWIYVIKSGSVNVLKKLERAQPTISNQSGRKKWQPKTDEDRYQAFIEGRYDEFCLENGIPIPSPSSMADTVTGGSPNPDIPHLPLRRIRRVSSLSAPNLKAHNSISAVAEANHISTPETPESIHKTRWKKVLKPKPKMSLAALIKKHVHISDAEDPDETEYIKKLYAGPQEFVPQEQRRRVSSAHRSLSILDQFNREYKKKAQLLTTADLNPQFVQVQLLTKGSTFGLVDVILGQQPSLCLVSNGAECLMIDKEFYRDNCPEFLQRHLLKTLSPYPEDEVIQEDLLTKLNWDSKREATLQQTIEKLTNQKQQHI